MTLKFLLVIGQLRHIIWSPVGGMRLCRGFWSHYFTVPQWIQVFPCPGLPESASTSTCFRKPIHATTLLLVSVATNPPHMHRGYLPPDLSSRWAPCLITCIPSAPGCTWAAAATLYLSCVLSDHPATQPHMHSHEHHPCCPHSFEVAATATATAKAVNKLKSHQNWGNILEVLKEGVK